LEATCAHRSWDPPPEVAPVQISFFNNVMMLRYEDGRKRTGALISDGLSHLVKKSSVTLAATLGTLNGQRRSGILLKSAWAFNTVVTRPLRVIIYGLLSEKDAVTSILDKNGLFLQRPEEYEYDKRVRYLNPMYLLPPGEDMPRVEGSSKVPAQGQMAVAIDEAQLGEVERSRLLRIFDEASGLEAHGSWEIKQSSRIVSTLKR
jgi:SWI/SNF-related matrix-associated actin-dependent regulator of chromatin subfamily A3